MSSVASSVMCVVRVVVALAWMGTRWMEGLVWSVPWIMFKHVILP